MSITVSSVSKYEFIIIMIILRLYNSLYNSFNVRITVLNCSQNVYAINRIISSLYNS